MIRSLAALILALAAPLAASAEETNFVFSPVGPGDGHGALGLGARLFLVDDGAPFPMVEVSYARGLSDALHLDASLTTLAVVNAGDVGLRYRLAGGHGSGLSLAVRGGITGVGAVNVGDSSSSGAFLGALTPGVAVGLGSRGFQVTLALDAPVVVVGASVESGRDTIFGTGAALFLRPAVSVEGALSQNVNLFLRGSFFVIPEAEFGAYLPSLSIGLSF